MAETEHWRLVLSRNQNLLGKCFLALRRHAESAAELTADEWRELRTELSRTTRRLREAFRPDHLNYAFLQNEVRHVHLHVIPRYASERRFAGLVFEDPDYPSHYASPSPARELTSDQMTGLSDALSRSPQPG